MLSASPVFTQKTEYAYAVARIRALETRLLDAAGYNALLGAPIERFASALAEVAGIRSGSGFEPGGLLAGIEDSYTRTFAAVKELVLDDPMRRLLSLKYDYEILKAIVKEERGYPSAPLREIGLRSNYSQPVLKALLEGGRTTASGEHLMGAYLTCRKQREPTGKTIDDACDGAYYREAFSLLGTLKNDFTSGYFVREVDSKNILTALRLKARGDRRAGIRERFIPFGSLDVSYLEAAFEANLDGFGSRVAFSPFAAAMKSAAKFPDEKGQIAILERLFDEELLRYLKQSMFVTFGVEPLFTYLLFRENEARNIRLILLAKASGVPSEEIKTHMRGFNG